MRIKDIQIILHRIYGYLYSETETLALWIPVAFAVGCLIYFLFPVEPSFIFGVAALLGGSVFVVGLRYCYTAYLGLYQISWAITLIALGFCLSWWQTHRQEPFYSVPFHATIVQGKVKSIEYLSSGKRRITLKETQFLIPPELDQQQWKRFIRFTVYKKDHQSFQNGDVVQVKVMLHRPPAPQYVGGYDLQFRSWFNNIGAYGYALEPVKILSIQPIYSIQNLREKIAAHIRQIAPGPSGVIAQILLTGMGGELSSNVRHAFAASGLAHLLAIAGLHLGIVMSVVTYAVRWLLLRSQVLTLYWPIKTIAIVAGWAVGCFYLVLTGLHLPALRSLLMASIVMLALLYNRPVFSKYNLMLAALFMLLFSPASVLDVSFQMSMVAVMALISGYHLINRWFGNELKDHFYGLYFIKKYLLEAAWVSVLAGTAVVPVVMFYFHELNLYFVFANLIAVPLMAFWVMPFGLLALCAMPLGLEYIFLKLMTFGIHWIVVLAEWVSALPFASIIIPIFPAWGYVLYIFGICVLCLCITPIRIIGIIMMAAGISSIFFGVMPDVVTTANGRMIGIKDHQQLFLVCQAECDATTVKEWQKFLNISQVKKISANDNGEGFSCYKNYCVFDQQKILVFLDFPSAEQQLDVCETCVLEFSFLWNGAICKNIPEINKKSNWINGAHSIWLYPLKIRTDLEKRGKRLWVMEPIQRGIPKMSMAQQE